ncbi:MAG: flippase [Deltaproteobacteria bacterium]|nr:flippase [Deltaproteobacteria bacterium]
MKAMPISVNIFKNSSWNLILFISQGLAGVFASILIARYLGPTLMGEYSFIIWLVGIMVILAGMGLPNTITKFISELTGSGNKETAQAIYARLLQIQCIVPLFIAIILIVIFYPTLSPIKRDYYLIAFLAFTPLCISAFFTSAFHGLQNFRITSIVGSVINLIQLLLVVACIVLDVGLKGLLAIPLVSGIFQVLLLIKYIPFKIKSPFKIPKDNSSNIIKYTLSVYWTIILSMIVWQKSEVFFLKIYSTPEDIAFYSIAFNISMTMIGLTALFSTVIFPVLSNYYGAGDREGIQNVYNKSIKAIVIFYLPICIIVIAIARPIVLLMYSSRYLAVSPPLIILMMSTIFSALGMLFANLTLAVNRTDIQVKYGTLAAVANIALDFILIPRYGAVGAALANSSVHIIATSIYIGVINRQLSFSFPTREIVMCLLPNIPLAVILCFFGNHYQNLFGIVLVLILTVFVYPLLLFIFKTITNDDIRIAKEVSAILPAPYEKMLNSIFDRIPIRQETH